MSSASLAVTLTQTIPLWIGVKKGLSIEKVLEGLPKDSENRSACQSVLYTAVRQRALLQKLSSDLISRAPADDVLALIELALGLLSEGKEKPFTVVNEAVAAAKHSRKMMKAANFVNAILRRFGREKTELLAKAEKQPTVRFNAPDWWIRRYEAVFGEQAPEIFALQQKHPPMTLRVNTRKVSVEEAKAKLEKARIPTERVGKFGLILLSPKPVKDVPGFTEGEVSVQDAGSQLAAELLDAKKGMRVLDACAAPGGKTAHILELAEVDVTALEIDPKRASRITENLDRLGLKAKVAVADAGEPKKWWDGRPFERILLDAPCTASGIVRRHPDIPWSRKPEDIGKLARTQEKLLETMWPLLANNGRILYAVCSVFPEEGPRGIEGFCARHPDAKLIPIGPKGEKLLSLAPAESLQDSDSVWPATHDGFFYALLEKI